MTKVIEGVRFALLRFVEICESIEVPASVATMAQSGVLEEAGIDMQDMAIAVFEAKAIGQITEDEHGVYRLTNAGRDALGARALMRAARQGT